MTDRNADHRQPPRPRDGTGRERRRGWPGWAWALLVLALAIVLPVAACGAFGFAVTAAGRQPSASLVAGEAVAVINVDGQITAGESTGLGGAVAGSETIINLIEQAAESEGIEAIVLRVNSPGGDVVASDEIYHALEMVDKPIVVSMGSLAASGGYYISLSADYIYATPYTLTGSIGVISQFFNAEELLDELGVEVTTITSGEVKDFGNFARDMTEEEREYWNALINVTYEGFVELVAVERDLPADEVLEVADGRIILGVDAVELGLVDEVGYYEDAIATAAELAGIAGEPRVIELEPDVGLFEGLAGFEASMQQVEALELLRRHLAPQSLEFRYLGP